VNCLNSEIRVVKCKSLTKARTAVYRMVCVARGPLRTNFCLLW